MFSTKTLTVSTFLNSVSNKITISKDRQKLLTNIAEKIAFEIQAHNNVNLNFICTHNSRRSQISQTWAFYISNMMGIPVNCFSGGTEVTAFHRNSVKSLKDIGFKFNISEFSHQNPVYEISIENISKKMIGFSKTYDHDINKKPFIAITTCNNADQNCPFIPEAISRFHLPYTDPKHADGTSEQEKAYMSTNKEIAAELNYLFLEVKKLIK